MFDEGTLEQVLEIAPRSSFAKDFPQYHKVILTLFDVGVLKSQQVRPVYFDQNLKQNVIGINPVKKYEIVEKSVETSKEIAKMLIEQLEQTNLDFRDSDYKIDERDDSRVIEIARSKVGLDKKDYVYIHYREG